MYQFGSRHVCIHERLVLSVSEGKNSTHPVDKRYRNLPKRKRMRIGQSQGVQYISHSCTIVATDVTENCFPCSCLSHSACLRPATRCKVSRASSHRKCVAVFNTFFANTFATKFYAILRSFMILFLNDN